MRYLWTKLFGWRVWLLDLGDQEVRKARAFRTPFGVVIKDRYHCKLVDKEGCVTYFNRKMRVIDSGDLRQDVARFSPLTEVSVASETYDE